MVSPDGNPRAGLTLLELMIGLFVLGTISYALGSSLQRSLGLYRTTTLDLTLERKFERAVDRLRRELRGAAGASLTPIPVSLPGGPTAWTDDLTFRQVESWGAGVPTLGPQVRIETRLEPGETDDDTDEDGDGLVDERELIVTTDFGGAAPQMLVIATGVPEMFPGETDDGDDDNGNQLEDEPGLCFAIEDDVVTVRLALVDVLPDGTTAARTRTFTLPLAN